MKFETDEDYVAVKTELLNIINTAAWKEVLSMVSFKREALHATMRRSDDPQVILSCVKQGMGLDFVFEAIDNLIQAGVEAEERIEAQK